MARRSTLLLAFLLVLPATWAQKSGGGSSPGKGSGTPSNSVPINPGTSNNTQPLQRSIIIMGKVMLDDGSAPSERVGIRRSCQGTNSRIETHTDSKGTFSFEIGGGHPQFSADASDSNVPFQSPNGDPLSQMPGFNVGMNSSSANNTSLEQQIWSCEITAELAGYRSDTISLAGRHALDNPDVGTIVLRRLANVSGSTISVTSMQAPKDARKEYEKGRDLFAKNKVTEAEEHTQKAVTQYSQYAAAWSLLGQIQERQKDLEGARKSFGEAIKADPKFMQPYLGMALLSAAESKWADAAAMSAKVIELDAVDYAQAFYVNAVANFNLGKLQDAETADHKAEQLDTQHRFPRIQLLMGTLLSNRGDYADAAAELRTYLKLIPADGDEAASAHKILAAVEKAGGPAVQAPAPVAQQQQH